MEEIDYIRNMTRLTCMSIKIHLDERKVPDTNSKDMNQTIHPKSEIVNM